MLEINNKERQPGPHSYTTSIALKKVQLRQHEARRQNGMDTAR